LALTNIRNTHGELGGTRPDNKFLPGDVVFVGFDIDGLVVGSKGEVKYTMDMKVVDKNGKSLIPASEPASKTDYVPLGGKTIPGRAFITLGLDAEPGPCTMTLSVRDDVTMQSKSFTHQFEVLKKDFGIVAVFASQNIEGTVSAPTTSVVGSMIAIRYGIVNFQRDPATKQPNVQVDITPLDDKGQPTIKEAIVRTYNAGIAEDTPAFPDGFLLPLTRAGKFTIRIKATDKVNNKSYTFDLPITAIPPN
jgi:hypothetical protein